MSLHVIAHILAFGGTFTEQTLECLLYPTWMGPILQILKALTSILQLLLHSLVIVALIDLESAKNSNVETLPPPSKMGGAPGLETKSR